MFDAAVGAAWQVIKFLQNYNGAVTATATVAIGFFTYFLVRVTGRQARLTRDTLNLARDEFNATHRPKIDIRFVGLKLRQVSGPDDLAVEALVEYINVGNTSANVIEVTAEIVRRPLPLQTGMQVIRESQRRSDSPLTSGIGDYFHVHSEYRLYQHRRIQETDPNPSSFVVCLGKIVYTDARGARRATGFCRKLDAVGERWLPIDNSEYEYAY